MSTLFDQFLTVSGTNLDHKLMLIVCAGAAVTRHPGSVAAAVVRVGGAGWVSGGQAGRRLRVGTGETGGTGTGGKGSGRKRRRGSDTDSDGKERIPNRAQNRDPAQSQDPVGSPDREVGKDSYSTICCDVCYFCVIVCYIVFYYFGSSFLFY